MITLVTGEKYKLFYQKGNINNCIIEIRGVIDDEYIVFRVKHRTKKEWIYCIEWIYWFEARKDVLTKI